MAHSFYKMGYAGLDCPENCTDEQYNVWSMGYRAEKRDREHLNKLRNDYLRNLMGVIPLHDAISRVNDLTPVLKHFGAMA